MSVVIEKINLSPLVSLEKNEIYPLDYAKTQIFIWNGIADMRTGQWDE